jgi:pimeloyl-ACP methyl ester carboxylesterase
LNANPLTLPIVIVLVAILIVALSIRRLRTLQQTPHGKWRRITERVLLSLVNLVCVLLAGCTAYNAVALRYYRALYPLPGKIYSVNGHDMHLYCTGEGSPTIVLESGGGNGMLKWAKVQTALSKTTRVCSYDRAGFGWSTPVPGPRDANTIADELHALLQQAGVRGPFVLMAHSRGGLYIRAYTAHYPEDVTGLIFIESAAPLYEDRESPELRAATSHSQYVYYPFILLMATGLQRPMGACSAEPGFDQPDASRIAQLECGRQFDPIFREYMSTHRDGEETINTGPYGDIPVLIFSRDTQLDQQNMNLPPKLAVEESTLWDREQEAFKRLSTHSRRIIAKGSGHPIQVERADLINREVAIFIQQLRSNEQRTDYGSTKTE